MLRNYRWDKEAAMSSDGFAGASATNLIEMLFEMEVVAYVVTKYSILFY